MNDELEFCSFDEVTPQMSIKEQLLTLGREYAAINCHGYEDETIKLVKSVIANGDLEIIGRAYDSFIQWKFGEKK